MVVKSGTGDVNELLLPVAETAIALIDGPGKY